MADDTRQTLDIPNGTTFEFQDGKLVFGHESDIVIRTNMGGYKFRKIFSKNGSVHVMPPQGVEFEVDEIEAASGEITLTGAVRVHRTRAKTVRFTEGRLTADRIEAEREVQLSGQQVDVLHVKAPKVTIDPKCEGTCLVVESQTDPGSYRARGGFRSVEEAQATFDRFVRLGEGEEPSAKPPSGGPPGGGGSRAEAQRGAEARPAMAAPTAPGPVGQYRTPSAVAAPSAFAEPEAPAMIEGVATADGTDTQEFRPVKRSEDDRPNPSLPKSSVFRKRK